MSVKLPGAVCSNGWLDMIVEAEQINVYRLSVEFGR